MVRIESGAVALEKHVIVAQKVIVTIYYRKPKIYVHTPKNSM